MYFLEVNCESLMPIIRVIKDGVIPLIQIGVPILLIVMGTIDLGKAVIASKEDEIKNAQKMLIKRAMYAVAVFFVVTIVTVVFSLLGTTENEDIESGATSWTSCWNYDKNNDKNN